jgi:heterodisulfide reductase subunit A-like polyferredoxin
MSLARSRGVVVIGGGAAGTAAALGAANAGAQTLLVESGPFLGGAATLKNVLTYCGLFTVSAGGKGSHFGRFRPEPVIHP